MRLSSFLQRGFVLAVATIGLLWSFSAVANADTGDLTTAQSRFTTNVNNQGWWSPTIANINTNDNYLVGRWSGDLRRDFLTFDLSKISCTALSTPRVRAATLVLTHGTSAGNAIHTLGIFDVSTAAATLNNNVGTSTPIYNDLGGGTQYGTANIANGATGTSSITLNAAAINAINATIGSPASWPPAATYFSVGGSLTNLAASGDDYLFLNSSGFLNKLTLDFDCVPNVCLGLVPGGIFPHVRYGTAGNDVIRITGSGSWLVYGLAGDDFIAMQGFNGPNCIVGGAGADTITGSPFMRDVCVTNATGNNTPDPSSGLESSKDYTTFCRTVVPAQPPTGSE